MFLNKSANDKNKYVWAFKHSPQKFDDLILLNSLTPKFKKIIETKSLPDLLLYGPPGLGKTSLVNVLKNELDLDMLYINGSLDNSIDIIRTWVSDFTRRSSNKQKCVFIDEIDRMTAGMDALKAETEQCKKTSFIFATNHIEKIIDPLISRCGGGISFFYSNEQKKELQKKYYKRCCEILEIENVQYDPKAVAKIVQRRFPDMRNTIHDLQSLYDQFEKIDLKNVDSLVFNLDEFFELIKSKNFDKIRYYVANLTNHTQIYSAIVNRIENYIGSNSISDVIDSCYEHAKTASKAIDPSLVLVHFCVSLMRCEIL